MRYETPFGPAWAFVNEAGALTAFGFGEPRQEHKHSKAAGKQDPERANAALAQQLAEFFAGN